MLTGEVVEVIRKPSTYYRNQVMDSRGQWRDVAPEFRNLVQAREAAQHLSLESGDVRIMKYNNEEENN